MRTSADDRRRGGQPASAVRALCASLALSVPALSQCPDLDPCHLSVVYSSYGYAHPCNVERLWSQPYLCDMRNANCTLGPTNIDLTVSCVQLGSTPRSVIAQTTTDPNAYIPYGSIVLVSLDAADFSNPIETYYPFMTQQLCSRCFIKTPFIAYEMFVWPTGLGAFAQYAFPWSFQIPDNAGLYGIQMYHQALIFTSGGLMASNEVRSTIWGHP